MFLKEITRLRHLRSEISTSIRRGSMWATRIQLFPLTEFLLKSERICGGYQITQALSKYLRLYRKRTSVLPFLVRDSCNSFNMNGL
jgi:hypothetical protein